MSVQQENKKAFVSAVELAELLALSKSRFHALVQAGVFPKPVRHESCKRPLFDLELQEKCIEIRATGIGLSGQPVAFNRMQANRKPRQQRQPQRPLEHRPDEHGDLVDALKSLGLTATSEAVGQALTELFPDGVPNDKGQVIRAAFLHLKQKK